MTQDGSWIARFIDGPAVDDVDHIFVVGPIWREICVVLIPATERRDEHWMICGGDGIDGGGGIGFYDGPTRVPYEGEVTYRLSHTSLAEPPDVVAYYTSEPQA